MSRFLLQQPHAECLYSEADLVKSAPVKVLLFRHLSYLQSAIRKGAHEQHIEDIIPTTTLLYKHWNKTHGAFFRVLVENYSAVLHRIQGWFLSISAHWRLATLMFADLLNSIDENTLGVEGLAHARNITQVAKEIRKHSAKELSDLAQVGTPPTGNDGLSIPQMRDFHHDVNKGMLLTEL